MIKGIYPRRFILIGLAAILLASAGCGPGEDAAGQGAASEKPPPAPEPAEAPPLDKEPAGRVVEVGNSPEGIAADPETGLVAVGLRSPDELALVDGESGEVVKRVELPESPRHLEIAGPGGPVLVPAEGSDSLVQVGLPDGEIVSETPVGDFPHSAAAAPNGRIFVVNEFGSTAWSSSPWKGARSARSPATPPSASRTPWPWTRPAGACSSPGNRTGNCRSSTRGKPA